VDGDGRDELAVGYSLVDHDGRILWSHDRDLQDHADGVAIVPFEEGEAPRLLCAASDEGISFADLGGRILRHLQPYEIWIYTQSDGPRSGRLYRPKRNPRWNASNYEATVSLPGWSE
jgi:hypothetical protein